MYTFISSQDKKKLHTKYLSLFTKDLDNVWKNKVTSCQLLNAAMLPGMTAKKLLVAEFRVLVNVYHYYINYVNGLSDYDKRIVQDAANDVFKYESYSKRIADFLINPSNGYKISNCVYCDTVNVSPFPGHKRRIRRFQTDHVLNRGACPLVALSLHNFVPSCNICNGANLKGTNTIGDTIEEIKHLSPTNPSYNFWHKVLFVVNPKYSWVSDNKKSEHPEHYEIDFYYKDKVYAKSVDLFCLKEKYNNDYLNKALELIDKKGTYTPVWVRDLANKTGQPYSKVYEDLFGIDKDQLYRKATEDILGITDLY